MSNLREDLIRAKALIGTPKKWGKGWGSKRGGRECAATVCLCVRGDAGELIDQLYKALPEPWKSGPTTRLFDFNDHPDTTHADIMALFDRAISAAEGGAS